MCQTGTHEQYEEHQENGGRGCSAAYNLAVDWFHGFIKMAADQLPNSSTRTLPSCLSKVAVYELYCEQMNGKPTLGCASFDYGLWNPDPRVVFATNQQVAEIVDECCTRHFERAGI